ncbi:MAG: ABC transporter ATP-binding protein [Clostridia bacterium]|nr:ABC transporter ATP-binding protein [Clostridia bacterium]
MAGLTLKHICKRYPGGVVAVNDFNLEIKDKEFLVLVGPSGCGKSTTLRMIAGLEEISEGELFIDGKFVNDIPPKDRDIAMVFQNYALYPHMTVFENMAFGLKLRKTPKEEIRRRVDEAARILDIAHLLDRKPNALSGGQKQRVALGRCIVREPKVFLLDEPLSNLDAKLRAQMRTELSKIHATLGITFIYVTHDQVEAMTMATRIVVLKDGFMQQVDTPQRLYDEPTNLFVAGFIGTPQMNFIDAHIEKDADNLYLTFAGCRVKIPEDKAKAEELKPYIGQDVIFGIRSEAIHDEPMYLTSMPDSIVSATVEVTELMGDKIYLYLALGENNLVASVSPRSKAKVGDTVQITFDMSRAHFFDKQTEKAILH